MAEAATVEQIWQDFKDDAFVVLGMDVWDGSPAQLKANFRLRGRTSYPLLLDGSPVVRAYGLAYEDFLVIDHTGIIRYHPSQGVSFKRIRTTIQTALEALPQDQPEVVAHPTGPDTEPEETPTQPAPAPRPPLTWGLIKAGAAAQ